MCGVVGLASNTNRVEEEALWRASESLKHRGPDAQNIWVSRDKSIGLAHRRLAIIDLSPGGRQPMADGHGNCLVVFNGEIYNFQDLREELQGYGWSF